MGDESDNTPATAIASLSKSTEANKPVKELSVVGPIPGGREVSGSLKAAFYIRIRAAKANNDRHCGEVDKQRGIVGKLA